jgi:hypothetical protein
VWKCTKTISESLIILFNTWMNPKKTAIHYQKETYYRTMTDKIRIWSNDHLLKQTLPFIFKVWLFKCIYLDLCRFNSTQSINWFKIQPATTYQRQGKKVLRTRGFEISKNQGFRVKKCLGFQVSNLKCLKISGFWGL